MGHRLSIHTVAGLRLGVVLLGALVGGLLAVLLGGCGGGAPGDVVAYVSHDLIYAGPVLEELERRTGLLMEGEAAVCLTDTDDSNGAIEKGKPVAMVYPDQDGIGTLVIPNSVCLVKGGPHPEAGRRLVDFLASAEVEAMLARSRAAQMPLRAGIPPHSGAFDLSKVRAMAVDWTKAAAVVPESARFLEESFLR